MIDWERIAELRAEVGQEDLEEVLDLFCAEVGEVLDGLTAKSEGLSGKIHFLKGSALNIGFQGLADRCAAIEMALAEGGEAQGIDELLPSFQESQKALAHKV